MVDKVNLPYGSDTIDFEFAQPPDIWAITDPTPVITPDLFRKRVADALRQNPLNLDRTAIVVGDKTRLCGYPEYLPVLIDTLVAAGMNERQLTIFIAYGTHAAQNEAQCRKAYGAAYDRGHWHHHQCEDQGQFVELGATANGTPVKLPATLVEADTRITFGAISHHYFAGYGGGRKLIFPGLGERNAIYTNHGLFLDGRTHRLAAGCRSGRITGNPLAEDLDQVATFCPAHMAIHGILDSTGHVCDLVVGSGRQHFQTACDQHARHCETPGADYDLVLASCGGFPKDINFIQSHKAVNNAAAFVRDGGRLIVLAQCRDGVGSQTFLPWFQMDGWDAAFDRLAENYVGNGGTALSMIAKTNRIRIDLVTELNDDIAEIMDIRRMTSDQAVQIIKTFNGTSGVIPNASMLVRVEGGVQTEE